MPEVDPRLTAQLYRDTKERIVTLVTEIGGAASDIAVAACPGWSVRDVVAHVTAVAEDWSLGLLTGPPTDEDTAAHVARFAGHDLTGILAAWTDATAQLDHLAETAALEAPVGDVVCHEHDLRGAIGQPGARDSAAVRHSSHQLLEMLRTPVPMRVRVEDREYRCGPEGGAEILLRTTRFETLRWRTGRRSRAQLAAMDWSADPTPVLDRLHLFGPASADLIE